MNESVLLTLQAVVWLVVGLAFIVIPVRWSEPFDFHLDRSGVFFARLAGSLFVGFAVLDWLARDQDPATLGPIIAGNLIANAISAVVHLNAVTSGLHNVRGWGPVALIVALTVGWIAALAL